MNVKEKIRRIRLDRAIDKINRLCSTLDETSWPDTAMEIRSHLAYIADAEMQRRHAGIIPKYQIKQTPRILEEKWWLKSRPDTRGVQVNKDLPPCLEFYVPWWAWPLEFLSNLLYGKTRLNMICEEGICILNKDAIVKITTFNAEDPIKTVEETRDDIKLSRSACDYDHSNLQDRLLYLIDMINETQECILDSGKFAASCCDNLRRIAKDCLTLADEKVKRDEKSKNN